MTFQVGDDASSTLGGHRSKAHAFKPSIEMRAVDELTPYGGNARTHSANQISQITRSIEVFGFTNPVLIADDGGIIAGHGRVLAARQLGLTEIPTVRLSHLDEAQRRAYVIADNKLALNAGWDEELLAIELKGLADLEFDLDLTGFSTAEIDIAFQAVDVAGRDGEDSADAVPEPPTAPVTRPGDVWLLGNHRLMCGDARRNESFTILMGSLRADLIFTDPPYNVRIDGNVCGSGSVHHEEFAFASGEMDRVSFTEFLRETLGHAGERARSGAIAYVCMDWRHMREMLDAGEAALGELKNLCVWNKSNGGMGTFYRSKHELVFVFKKPGGRHVNNFGLGEHGRYRTNVWDYPGISSLGPGRSEALAMHPTVKPVALIADAICDCSSHNDIVLDCFGGSGSTLVAAERTLRRAFLIEYQPSYCDVAIARWQSMTGASAILAETNQPFAAVGLERNRAEIHRGNAPQTDLTRGSHGA
ncbi:DNA methylase N-4 [bacterium]|nr:DNA methylase N-4 [bacterium]